MTSNNKPKLIFFQGLPASGKSTIAFEMAQADPENIIVVEKDQIRATLVAQGWKWSREAEAKDVIPERDRLIEEGLAAGKTVISSDTNFGREHKVQLEKLARRYQASFETVRLDVPLDECLRRNETRENKVPEKVIKDMYHRYVVNDPTRWPKSAPSVFAEPAPTVADDGSPLMPALIVDLDGTLALNNGHRSFYDATTADQDALCPEVYRLIKTYHDHLGYQIIYCSGREDKFREPTERFLLKHNCPLGPLLMRATGDHRKDSTVKLELFNASIRGRYRVEAVIDDRPQVLRMWQSIGLFTFAVGKLEEF